MSHLENAEVMSTCTQGWVSELQLKPPPDCVGRGAVFPGQYTVISAALFVFLCRKGPVEAKSESQESEAKPAPTEVKTVPNDATQTKENESKA